jgi:hypothetical protein
VWVLLPLEECDPHINAVAVCLSTTMTRSQDSAPISQSSTGLLRRFAQEDRGWEDLCGAGDREFQSLELRSQFFPLRSVPNGTDNHPPPTHTIKNNARSAADDQLTDARLSPGAAQARMVSESFNHGDDSSSQPLGRFRLIFSRVNQRHISADFLKPCQMPAETI